MVHLCTFHRGFLFIYPVGIQIFVHTPPMHQYFKQLPSKCSYLYAKETKGGLLTGHRVANSAQPLLYLYIHSCLDVKKVRPVTESAVIYGEIR